MSRNVLFLDIDGVLNSTMYWWRNNPLPMGKAGAIDPDAVARLNKIVEATDPLIVLSSAWRMQGFPLVQSMLAERGFIGQLSDQTPVKPTSRWVEIDEWLYINRPLWRSFVVLDDDPEAWSNESAYALQGRYAATNYLHGLIDDHIPLITAWLRP